MYDRLIHFLDKYNILYQNQFGFRQGHHALNTLVDKIIKTFDTVDHTILFKKYTIMASVEI